MDWQNMITHNMNTGNIRSFGVQNLFLLQLVGAVGVVLFVHHLYTIS